GATPAPKPIGIVIFGQVASADVMGPADAFSQPSLSIDRRESRCYEVITIGINNHLCATESGIILKPQLDIRQAPRLDTLIIPGGAGLHDPKVNTRLGRKIALRVAREFVVPLKRSAGEEQYSESLKFQIQSCDRFADLPAWIVSHLNEDLSVDALAERACMSRRNFTRLFHNTFGKSPA